MGHLIEPSPSGRAKCRGCGTAVAKGVLRFGEAYSSAFTDGDSYRYWHLNCAAKKLPIELRRVMGEYSGAIPDKAEIEATMDEALKKGGAKIPLPHGDLAPTGRAKCITCGEGLPKGELRVAVEREVDTPAGRMRSAGYLHPACVADWAAENDEDGDALVELVLGNSVHLSEADKATLAERLSS